MNLTKLLNELTIEEKIGQLVMLSPHLFLDQSDTTVAGPLTEAGISKDQLYSVGSILGIGSAKEMIELQTKYLAQSRHKIPLIFMADIIHGYETIFPVPLALAASFDDSTLYKAARVSAKEASSAGIHVTFAPMVDLVRDPRWGRVVESFGEDPYLLKRFASAQVQGYQQKCVAYDTSIAACVKHFAAYGLSEAGRDYNTVDLSRYNLYQNYLRGYQGAINAQAKMVMTSFNVFEGIPATVNEFLLKKTLRGHLNFKGVIISDYASLKEVITHGVAKDEYEASVLGINAGLNIEMATTLYLNNLKKAIENQDISVKQIDRLVFEVLKLKQSLGLFKNPFKGASIKKERLVVRALNHLKEAQLAAEESIILLKNEQIFPIDKKTKIALIGPYADNPHLIGPWSWHGSKHRCSTLKEVFDPRFNVVYTANLEQLDMQRLTEAEVILMALGENACESGEASSKTSIRLSPQQEELVKTVKQHTQKPLGLILFNGRPLDLSNIIDDVAGVFECFFPGSMGSYALANLISGKVSPSGRLPLTFPRGIGQVPIYYNHLNTGRPYQAGAEYSSFYLDSSNQPLFAFGFGLSYATFKYQNLRLNQTTITPSETLEISVDVTNQSRLKAKEVIQLYLHDHYAKVSRPVKELINFTKVEFDSLETKTISFQITIDDLTYYLPNLTKQFDYGTFSLMIGPNSNDLRSIDFKLIKEKTHEETIYQDQS